MKLFFFFAAEKKSLISTIERQLDEVQELVWLDVMLYEKKEYYSLMCFCENDKTDLGQNFFFKA